MYIYIYICNLCCSHQLLRRPGYRSTIWVLEKKRIYKFLGVVFYGNTHEKYAGSTIASPWYILGVICTIVSRGWWFGSSIVFHLFVIGWRKETLWTRDGERLTTCDNEGLKSKRCYWMTASLQYTENAIRSMTVKVNIEQWLFRSFQTIPFYYVVYTCNYACTVPTIMFMVLLL